MKITMTKIAALVALAFSSTGAHAVLTSTNTLSIQVDAVTTFGYNPADTSTSATVEWYVSSNGPMPDSFFTIGGSQVKQIVETQYAFLYTGANLTLDGNIQSNIASFSYYGAPGSFKTLGTGISILSASGDTATVNMSGWTADWSSVQNMTLGTLAWAAGYTSGVGNLTCAAGSGCAIGSAYTLTYAATVPPGDSSGFGGIKYYLELHGTVGTVPEASTYGMLLAGLGLVGAAVRQRRACSAV
jgi:hypothetical protein